MKDNLIHCVKDIENEYSDTTDNKSDSIDEERYECKQSSKNKINNKSSINNKLADAFSENLREDMTDKAIVRFIFINSFFCILGKVLMTVNDSITISFLGHLKGAKLSPFFIASLIQNIWFKGIGYGFSTTSNMLASRAFGAGNFHEQGLCINRGKIILFIFSILCFIFSYFGKEFFLLLFSHDNIDLVCSFLIHNSISIFFQFQTTMQLTYLTSHNNFVYPAILDSISTLTLYLVFKIGFSVFSNEIISSDENTFIITAWCLNLTSFLSYLYYTVFIYYYNPSPESVVNLNRDSFKLGEFIYLSLHFIYFFVSHFLGGEQLNILINNYYGKQTTNYIAFTISQKVYFILHKFTIGFSFFIMSTTGSLITKKYYTLLKRITKIFYMFSYAVIIILVIFVELFANTIANFYTDKTYILAYVPRYMRIIVLITIPFHLENSLQSILTGYNKQMFPAYFSIIVTVTGGLGFGFLFIYGFDMGVKGVFLTMFILEILFSLVNLIFYLRIEKNS